MRSIRRSLALHTRRSPLAAVALLCAVIGATSVQAQEPTAGPSPLSLRTSVKIGGLLSRAPDDPWLFPDRTSQTGLARVRLDLQGRHRSWLTTAAAYEQRVRGSSEAAGLAGLGVLPPDTPAPYRLAQLDWQIAASPSYSWRHEVDRAYAAVHRTRGDVTVGRQAVGWGRGVLFGAVDLFSPFTPLEADREWRRGVDAIRADLRLTDRASIDTVAAFGERLDESAFATRLRGYAGRLDLEVVGGWRARDVLAGLTSSAAIAGAEVHGELAVFRAPEPLPASGPGGGRTAVKAVAGGSYRLPVGTGILVEAEYHYSGFGATRPEDIVPLLADPAFRTRYLRGDMQILGRHAFALVALQEFSPEYACSGQWLHNPADGSGVVVPSTTVTFGDRVSLVGMVYVPYGRPPDGLVLRSEYGAAALSGFVQLRIYR